MGYEILYCAGCQAQLRGPEFEAGTAFKHEGLAYCESCATDSVKAAARKSETSSVRSNPPTTRLQRGPSDTGRTTRLRRQKKSKAPVVIAVTGAAILLAGILIVAVSSSGKQAQDAADSASTPPDSKTELKSDPIPPLPERPDAAPPKEREARQELDRILASGGNREQHQRSLEEFIARFPDTFAAATARAKLKEIAPPPPPPSAPPKPVSIMPGAGLEGWQSVTGTPKVEAGELRLQDDSEIMRKLDSPDFELSGSIRLNLPRGNGGIAFRRPGHNRGEGSRFTLYGDGDVHYWTGTERAGRGRAGTFKMNEWQEFRLTVRKKNVVLEVGGRRVVEVESPFTEAGYLAFYGNKTGPDGLTAFKNLRLGP